MIGTQVPRLAVLTPPAGEVVSVGDIKAHSRIFDSDDDAYLGYIVSMVRATLERIQGRAYNTQTLELTLDAFPLWSTRDIPLSRPPLQSVTSIVYTTSDGIAHTLDPLTYHVDAKSAPGRVVLRVGQDWPSDELISVGGVVITYVAGYADFKTSTVTVSQASPAVVTWTAHGLATGAPVTLSSTIALPSGFASDVTYYVAAPATNTFQLALYPGGPSIATTTAGSGVHTARSAGAVPPTILHAIKFLAAYYYEHRELAEDLANLKELPKTFDYLLEQDRVSVFV